MRVAALALVIVAILSLVIPPAFAVFAEKALQGYDDSSSYFVVIHYPWWLSTGAFLSLSAAAVLFVWDRRNRRLGSKHKISRR